MRGSWLVRGGLWFMVVALGGGCASKPAPPPKPVCPSWALSLSVDPEQYSPREFYAVVGSSKGNWKTRERLESEATANALQQIAVQISAEVKTEREVVRRSVRSGGSRQVRTSSSGQRRTSVRSDLNLQGVQVARKCYDPALGDFYVLAALNKQRYAEGLRRQVQQLQADIRAELEAAAVLGEKPPPLQALRAYTRVLPQAERSSDWNALARSIDGEGVSLRYGGETVELRLRELRRQLPVRIAVDDADLAAAAAEAITAAGYPVEGREGASGRSVGRGALILSVTPETRTFYSKNAAAWICTCDAFVELAHDEQVLAAQKISAKQAGKAEHEAVARSYRFLAKGGGLLQQAVTHSLEKMERPQGS